MLRKTTLALLLAAAGVNAHALSAGDIAVIAYNADGNDNFAWVALTDIAANTTINFTDASWQGTAFRGTEHLDAGGPLTWTSSMALAAGTVVTYSGAVATPSWSTGTLTGSSVSLSASGDQIFAFMGSTLSPSFLFGLQFANASGIVAAPTVSSSTNTTNVPTGLSEAAGTMLDVGNFDNGYYAGPLSGTQASLLTAIADQSNWVRNDSGPLSASNWASAFTVAAVPEPESYAMFLAGLGLIGAVARRRAVR